MKKYIFKTTATMKDYNRDKWWIDSGIVGEICITAESVREALEKYRAIVEEEHYITISNNAIKNKSPMCRYSQRRNKTSGLCDYRKNGISR